MKDFYEPYHGHSLNDLQKIIDKAREENFSIIFLAGDSSLDNKFWVKDMQIIDNKNINIYSKFMNKYVQDIAYLFNEKLTDENKKYICVNCAVEESILRDRCDIKQDEIIQKNISENDILIISVGGNDIVLKPTLETILSLSNILLLNSENYEFLIDLFDYKYQSYVDWLCSRCSPKTIYACSLYYPHENKENVSWCDRTLKLIGYYNNPEKIQYLIRYVAENIMNKISEVEVIKLYEILDSKNDSLDYVQKVEPSIIGGRKIVDYFYQKIFDE